MRLHSSLHSADTFTTFWCVGPAGRWASPSGVVTGGVGMLMIAVVIWLLWQFRDAGSSTRMFRLERLQEGKEERQLRLTLVCICRDILLSYPPPLRIWVCDWRLLVHVPDQFWLRKSKWETFLFPLTTTRSRLIYCLPKEKIVLKV